MERNLALQFGRDKKLQFLSGFLLCCISLSAQEQKDSSKKSSFSGTVFITNNGISPIPAFSLDKAALMVFFTYRKGRFSYHPEFAFSSDSYPWFYNNWFRLRVIDKPRTRVTTGINYSLLFTKNTEMRNGTFEKNYTASRFLYIELAPSYQLSTKSSVGAIYWGGRGFEKNSIRDITYISLLYNLQGLELFRSLRLSFSPQVFYLGLGEGAKGIFTSGAITLSYKKLPISLSAQYNQLIETTITPAPDFKWNLSLVFNFSQ